MSRSFVFSLLIAGSTLPLWAATQPIYINNSPVHITTQGQIAPQIDATAVVNRSEFEINDVYFSGLPYETFNTYFFTNASAGIASGDVGFRYNFLNGNSRSPMKEWVNQGSIYGGTFLLVSATNITSTGPLGASERGLIRLSGKNVNLRGNGIRSGATGLFGGSGGSVNQTNYFNPVGVTDAYWAASSNNTLNGQGQKMPLTGGNFDLPFPFSPPHEVTFPPFGKFTEQLFVQNAGAFAYTTQLSTTSRVVQVIFVPTNSFFDTNLSVRAFFTSDQDNDNGLDAVVEFSYPEFDVVNQTFSTNYLYFIDQTAFATNIVLAKNLAATTVRPSTYNLVRSTTPFYTGFPGNTPYSPTLLYNPSLTSNSVNVSYVAYEADVSPINVLNGSGQNVYATTDPTNYPGRVEINADTVNLDGARIRAESTVIIKTSDLASNKVARISAPYENLDLRTSQPQLVITNFAPQVVQRLSGSIQAWSAIWANTEVTPNSTNQVQYHVLMLDHNLISTLPVVINEMALHAPNLVIGDPLAVKKSLLLDSRGLEVTGGLTLPAGVNWDNSNILELYNFTNRGIINVAQSEFAGTDRANPYDNYVNRGTNAAASHQIRTVNFDDSGCLIANSGVINLDATTALIAGKPPVTNVAFVAITNFPGTFSNFFALQPVTNILGAKIQAKADIQITANQLTLSNAVLQTGPGGSLDLLVSGRLSDAGPRAVSYWILGGGVHLPAKPASGDLLGTYVRSTVARNTEVFHTWSGDDRGVSNAGFSSNSALGKLSIDAGDFSVIHFSAPDTSTHKALYVDYLELLNYATNVNTQFAIDPSLTIYFANANLAATKLDGAAGGRLRWVKSFTGPLSSTNITYTTTNLDGTLVSKTYTFNTALVTDLDLNSDGDNLVNGNDPTPVYMPESVGMRIAFSRKLLPPQVSITWNALRGVTNTVLYRTNLTLGGWTVLANVVPPGPFSGPFTVRDFLPAGATNPVERIYRVQVNASP